MKHFEFRHANKPHMKALKLLVFFHILPLAAAYAQNDAFWETFPKDNGKALVNPHMGWTMHFYSNLLENYGSQLEASDTLDDFPGLSTVYLRLPWAYLEPKEGEFCWEIIDTPAQRWIEKGKKVAFRITATENWMESATPPWVFEAGAKSYKVKGVYEPEYDDPVFLEKAENFIKKMAQRYDGNPNVAFIDVGHFGMWGEGHTIFSTPTHGKSWGVGTQKRIIDIYRRHFKKTLLCISDDFAGHDSPGDRFEITDYAFSKGVTIRDDSILVQKPPRHWYHSGMAQLFWPKLPVILEHEHYAPAVQRGSWNKELLVKSVEDYHASYMSIHGWPRDVLDGNRDAIDRINMRLGYRINLEKIRWPKKIRKNEYFTIESAWKNAGVAPCYPGGYPAYTLKDEKGGIVSVLVEENLNVRNLKTASPGKAEAKTAKSKFIIARVHADAKGPHSRSCKPGKYSLYVSVGALDGTPGLELPYGDSDSNMRYKIGEITVEE